MAVLTLDLEWYHIAIIALAVLLIAGLVYYVTSRYYFLVHVKGLSAPVPMRTLACPTHTGGSREWHELAYITNEEKALLKSRGGLGAPLVLPNNVNTGIPCYPRDFQDEELARIAMTSGITADVEIDDDVQQIDDQQLHNQRAAKKMMQQIDDNVRKFTASLQGLNKDGRQAAYDRQIATVADDIRTTLGGEEIPASARAAMAKAEADLRKRTAVKTRARRSSRRS